jgi:polyisoprenoid-binding protein YceI
MKTLYPILFILLLVIAPQSLNAQSYMAEDGYTEFVSRAPLLEFKGKSNHLHGLVDLDKNLIDFYIDLNTLDTGIELRNRHMRDSYLRTDQCPFAEFRGELLTPFDPDVSQPQQVRTKGLFKVNCNEREVNISGTLKPTEEGLRLEAQFKIELSDYNIEKPRVIFYELAEEQVINLSILLQSEK